MRKLVFLDLDDTLFQSRRKCPTEVDLSPVAYLQDGSAHSFMTAKQRALWRLLESNATLIPTTARDLDALRRVELAFQQLVHPRLWGSHPGSGWPSRRALAGTHGRRSRGRPSAISPNCWTPPRASAARHGLALHVRIVGDFDLPFYLVAKYRDGREADLERLQRELIQPWIAGTDRPLSPASQRQQPGGAAPYPGQGTRRPLSDRPAWARMGRR